MKRIAPLVLAASVLLGTACSSDKNSIDVPDAGDVTLPGGDDITLPDDIDLPDGVTLPPNMTDDCVAISMEFARIISQVYTPTGEDLGDNPFENLSTRVPEDLRDDIQIVGEAFAEFSAVLQDNGNNYAAPEVQAASEALGTPEVEAASANLEAYFAAECPG